MSDDEEKRCPLCAEEMDWTDQQLKPCTCGYQVCVWCWNHIMDMTENNETGGRCPACRRPYDKEKVAGMEAKFERVVSNNSNRKQKPAKARPKTNEPRKDLSNVRVIQRKIAYVIGLPLSLADEDLLQRKEYFGQYGKVTKVSLSRTAGGAVQQFINDTCSVYVTYSKEEEAVRCIQYVHGFLLEGRFLRASFGTAKYCHAWLRNVPCNNPACLYLHTMGAEEDSFGKDEVAAVHTRNRLHQIAGDSHSLQNRSGNVLPPPIDYWKDSSENPAVKSGPKDLAIDTVNSSDQLISSSSFKDKNGGIPTASKTTTFVDIVARSCSSCSEKDGNVDEDRVFNLCSQSSSVSIDEDYNQEAKHSNEMPCEVSSCSHLVNGLPSNSEFKEPFRDQSYLMLNCGREVPHEPRINLIEDLLSFDDQSSKDNDSLSDLNADTVNTFANSIPCDGYNEGKFQSSAKSDMIYRCSNLFSNEEIVEHLRRLDDDDDTTNGENSALDAVKSSIISNIMSLDLDTFDELPKLPPHSSAGMFSETNGLQGSSWNFINSDQSSRFPFAKTGGSSSQLSDLDSSFSSISRESMRGTVLQDNGENKEHYLCKPAYNVSRAQNLIPPGFSLPSREPPPGFAERTDQVGRSTSGNHSVRTSLPTNHFRTPSGGGGTMSVTSDVDLIDPAIMHVLRGQTTNGSSNSCLDMRSHYASQTSSLEDEARLWHLMQQSAPRGQQVPKFPQTYSQQIPAHPDPRFSSWDDIYGISSRLMMDQQRTYNQTSFTEFSQQKFGQGHISNGCHQPSLDEMRHRNEVGMGEIQRNETLGGLNRLLPGYGDNIFQMPSSGDIYTRVFGM